MTNSMLEHGGLHWMYHASFFQVLWPLKVRCCESCRAKHVISDSELMALGISGCLLSRLPHMDTLFAVHRTMCAAMITCLC